MKIEETLRVVDKKLQVNNYLNIIIVDEFRMVDLDIINKVLRKFNTAPRQPKYLSKPEYAHLAERNKELYLVLRENRLSRRFSFSFT